MSQDKEIELNFSENVMTLIEELAKKTGWSEDQVVEHVIHEYLMNQIRIIEKRAAETNTDINDLVNMQFERLLEFLLSKYNQ
ncbi:hypothetical protein SAMN05660649_00410 [Desulfotomaculum arcticum]|uniref:Uncharacterized protein n=1 Tax=Desulfotruncus arcticus DSM 17038 TaxID=1121424 RepID=A0A1I2N7D2_9FIRM|nr:hypothetical protein [Desulfotruncus arcticus]SFF99845.1 hypothetical protein SAMN05660649_00410 [Desulfotomaculum arcticum] [Desulfotruncus arcticus DSM 17038]